MARTKKFVKKENDYVIASRSGEYNATKDFDGGFKSITRPHKNKKAYTRKPKHIALLAFIKMAE
jgi:hypothetical protein